MLPRSVVSLFCDDIREEKSGMSILIGIYPENVNVHSFPFAFPKIGMYTRINIDVEDSPGEIAVIISTPKNDDAVLTSFSEEFISKSQIKSKNNGSQMMGLIAQMVAAPFPVAEPGQIKIIVTIQGVEYLGGILNVNQAP